MIDRFRFSLSIEMTFVCQEIGAVTIVMMVMMIFSSGDHA